MWCDAMCSYAFVSCQVLLEHFFEVLPKLFLELSKRSCVLVSMLLEVFEKKKH